MRTLLLTSTLVLTGALLLPGQSNRLDRHDRDGDGVVTRAEWRGNAQTFERHDWNNDGMLSGDELLGNQRNQRQRTQTQRTQTRSRAVDQLDDNRSGVVEGYEWPYNRQVFHDLDTDANSVLSADELRNINTATLPQLDRNKDGRIDDEEWPGGFAQFDRLDENRDGRVTASEYFERGGEWQRRQRFDSWDRNRNGILESTEWKSDNSLFHRLDTSGDSKVSWEEFSRSTERYEPPFGRR
jgi:Ca2+-binding EF-hand superfamily protein